MLGTTIVDTEGVRTDPNHTNYYFFCSFLRSLKDQLAGFPDGRTGSGPSLLSLPPFYKVLKCTQKSSLCLQSFEAFSNVLVTIKAKLKHIPVHFVGQRAFRGVITVPDQQLFLSQMC